MARPFQVVMHQDTQSLLKSYLSLATLNTNPYEKIKKNIFSRVTKIFIPLLGNKNAWHNSVKALLDKIESVIFKFHGLNSIV